MNARVKRLCNDTAPVKVIEPGIKRIGAPFKEVRGVKPCQGCYHDSALRETNLLLKRKRMGPR